LAQLALIPASSAAPRFTSAIVFFPVMQASSSSPSISCPERERMADYLESIANQKPYRAKLWGKAIVAPFHDCRVHKIIEELARVEHHPLASRFER
jgi:hypothetical protein